MSDRGKIHHPGKFEQGIYTLNHQDTIKQYHKLPYKYHTVLINLGRQFLMTYLLHLQIKKEITSQAYQEKVSEIIQNSIVKCLREEECQKKCGKWDRESFFQLLLPKVMQQLAEQYFTFFELKGKSCPDSLDMKRLSSSSKPGEQEYKFGVVEVGSFYYLIGKTYDLIKDLLYFERIISLDTNEEVSFEDFLKQMEKEKVGFENADQSFRICFASKEIENFAISCQKRPYIGKVFKVKSQIYCSNNVYHSKYIYDVYEVFQRRMTLKRLVQPSILKKLLQKFGKETRTEFLRFIENFVVKPAQFERYYLEIKCDMSDEDTFLMMFERSNLESSQRKSCELPPSKLCEVGASAKYIKYDEIAEVQDRLVEEIISQLKKIQNTELFRQRQAV